jgi:hypothetical protein
MKKARNLIFTNYLALAVGAFSFIIITCQTYEAQIDGDNLFDTDQVVDILLNSSDKIDLSNLESNLYFLKINGQVLKLIKN